MTIDPYERLTNLFERAAKLVDQREQLLLEIARLELIVVLYSGRSVDNVNKNK
jgi:hypothetical protein